MSVICSCDAKVQHLGMPNCNDSFGILLRPIIVPIYKNDGTLNYIDTSAALSTQAYWDGLQYNTDETARFFPFTIDMEEVKNEKGETVYQQYASGRRSYVRDGVRTGSGMFPEAPAALVGKVNSKKCSLHGLMWMDHKGNLVGIEKVKGRLYPIQLAKNTLSAIFNPATDTTVPNVMLQWEYDQSVKDENLSFIPAGEIGIDLFTQFNGKTDAYVEQVGTGTTTGFTVDIFTSTGNAVKRTPVKGLVAADIVLYNISDSLAVTVGTLVESSTVPGRYTVTFTAQTNTDKIRLNLSTSTAAKPYDDGTWEETEFALQ